MKNPKEDETNQANLRDLEDLKENIKRVRRASKKLDVFLSLEETVKDKKHD